MILRNDRKDELSSRCHLLRVEIISVKTEDVDQSMSVIMLTFGYTTIHITTIGSATIDI